MLRTYRSAPARTLVLAGVSLAAGIFAGCGGGKTSGQDTSSGSSATAACKRVASANKLKTCVAVYDEAAKACNDNKAANRLPVGTKCDEEAAKAIASAAPRLVGDTTTTGAAPSSTEGSLSGSSIERLIVKELTARGYTGSVVTCPDVADRVGVKFACVVEGQKFTRVHGTVAADSTINLDSVS